MELINQKGARLMMYKEFVTEGIEDVKKLPLETRPPIIVYGKVCRQQRNVGFFSDSSEGYRYSNQIMRSQPMTEFLHRVMDKVNAELGTKFNGVLVNEYPDGKSYISAHSDDERSLDPTKSYVAALSFGETRTFRIRDRVTKAVVLDVETEPLSLLVMCGSFQKEFTHEVPPRANKGPRWSLTFRHHTS